MISQPRKEQVVGAQRCPTVLDRPWHCFRGSGSDGYVYGIEDGVLPAEEHLEITGYVLSAETAAAGAGCAEAASAARGTADFLMRHQAPDGSFPHSIRHQRPTKSRGHEHHVFDTAICSSALGRFGRCFNVPEALRCAHAAAEWTALAWAPGIDPYALYDSRRGGWDSESRRGVWSSDGGCYLGKVLICWMEHGLMQHADAFADHWLSRQRPDGLWDASSTVSAAHSHALCYLLEGILFHSAFTGSHEGFRAVIRCLVALGDKAVHHEGLPEWLDSRDPIFRSDSQLQFLRLLCLSGLRLPRAREATRRRLETLRGSSGLVHSSARRNFRPCWSTVFEATLPLCASGAVKELI